MPSATPGLERRLGLLGLTATGVCAMLGAAINIIPIMLQRNVPGIGSHVIPAYFLGAVPALLAAVAYAILASAMPRAGGSYVYASRSLHPYLGFVASFSQWFGLSIAIGVVSYVLVPFLRDVAATLGWTGTAELLATPPIRVGLSLAFLWFFVAVNVLGLALYERILVPLMVVMFAGGVVVIVAGFSHDQADFAAAVAAREGLNVAVAPSTPLDFSKLLAAAAILFASFIGFDAIAQAGGEAKNPERNMPLAIGIAIVGVGSFYLLFTGAVYHAVPWSFIAERAQTSDLTAPGLLGYLLPPGLTVIIIASAAIALINDLPAMLLSVSRLMFAWAEDGIFFPRLAAIHPRFHTPHLTLILSGLTASAGILGCHLAGDFFLGVDILATSMLVNFLLMSLSVLWLPRRNPELAARIRFVRDGRLRFVLGLAGVLSLTVFLIAHLAKDLTADVPAWYFHSTWLWLGVMLMASGLFAVYWRRLGRSGVDLEQRFSTLPPQ